MNPKLLAELRKMLRSKNRHERAEAAIALGQSGVIELLPEVEELIKEEEGVVAVAGMYASWQLAGRGIDVKRLIDIVLGGEEEEVQMVVQVVSSIGEPLVEEMSHCLGGAEAEAMIALELLDEIGGTKARRVVEEFPAVSPEAMRLKEKLLAEWHEGDNDEDRG
jgi:hypothetical protein